METYIIIVFVLLFFFGIIIAKSAQQEQKHIAEQARLKEERKMRLERKQKEFIDAEDRLVKRFGTPSHKLKKVYSPECIEDYVYVFADSEMIVSGNDEIPFANVLRCELVDNQNSRTVTTGGEVKQEFNVFDAVGKADAARMMFGRSGAEYAAANSANKVKVTPVKTSVVTTHNYSVNVYQKDIKNPYLPINFKAQGENARTLVGVIEAVIAMRENK